jgi:hypothetical protein
MVLTCGEDSDWWVMKKEGMMNDGINALKLKTRSSRYQ